MEVAIYGLSLFKIKHRFYESLGKYVNHKMKTHHFKFKAYFNMLGFFSIFVLNF